jgi:integrase
VYSNRNRLTFGEFAQPFFSVTCLRLQRSRLSGRTFSPRYIEEQRRILTQCILTDNTLCSTAVNKLNRRDLELFVLRVVQRCGYSRKSKAIVDLVKLITKELYNYDYIAHDYTKTLCSIHYQEAPRGILSRSEVRLLLSDEPYESLKEQTFFTVSYLCGLRKSEVLALKWKDIDFKYNTVHVMRAWKSETEIGLPKSGKPRISWLPLPAKKLLTAYHGAGDLPENFVFTSDRKLCQRLSNTWVQKHFVKIMDRMDVKRTEYNITFHSLRHTLKSELSHAGMPQEMQQQLFGWSDSTADAMARRYTHLDDGRISELVGAWNFHQGRIHEPHVWLGKQAGKSFRTGY